MTLTETPTDVGLSILDPESGERFVVDVVAAGHASVVPAFAPHETCRFPTPADPYRLCMLRTGHGGACLPVPGGRGIAVR